MFKIWYTTEICYIYPVHVDSSMSDDGMYEVMLHCASYLLCRFICDNDDGV